LLLWYRIIEKWLHLALKRSQDKPERERVELDPMPLIMLEEDPQERELLLLKKLK